MKEQLEKALWCIGCVSKSFFMQKIKIGEIQPVECDNCQAKEGYQYSLHKPTLYDISR